MSFPGCKESAAWSWACSGRVKKGRSVTSTLDALSYRVWWQLYLLFLCMFSGVNTSYWFSASSRHICRFTASSASSLVSLLFPTALCVFSFFLILFHQVTIPPVTSHSQYMFLPFVTCYFPFFQNCLCYSHYYLITSFRTFKLHLFRASTNTLRHTTFGRIPMDEWSARLTDLFLSTHKTPKRQTTMLPAGFETSKWAAADPRLRPLPVTSIAVIQ